MHFIFFGRVVSYVYLERYCLNFFNSVKVRPFLKCTYLILLFLDNKYIYIYIKYDILTIIFLYHYIIIFISFNCKFIFYYILRII